MKQKFFNLQMDVMDVQEVMKRCENFFSSPKAHTIFFLNAHCFNVAQKNPDYHHALNQADLLLNDGIGLEIASRLSPFRFKENLNGTDLIPKILHLASVNQKKIFLLGGEEGVVTRAAEKIKEQNPEAHIAGHHSGFFSQEQEQDVIEKIRVSGARILVIGMGVPKQELWAHRNKELLKSVNIIIAGGAVLDFISGKVNRAPAWIRKIHMEWVFRLMMEPRRMWKRYLVGNVVFFWNILRIKSRPA